MYLPRLEHHGAKNENICYTVQKQIRICILQHPFALHQGKVRKWLQLSREDIFNSPIGRKPIERESLTPSMDSSMPPAATIPPACHPSFPRVLLDGYKTLATNHLPINPPHDSLRQRSGPSIRPQLNPFFPGKDIIRHHEGMHLDPHRPGRHPDGKRLLGALLPRAWHPARWDDAQRRLHRAS